MTRNMFVKNMLKKLSPSAEHGPKWNMALYMRLSASIVATCIAAHFALCHAL